MKRLTIARYGLWLLCAACVLADASSRHFGFPLAFAQDQPTSPTQVVINQIDASAFPNIKLFVSVQDAAGKMVRGLESKDFFVTEDEVEQSPVTVATQLPSVATALVLDTSGSMKGAIADTKQAATAYVDLARPEDEMCLMVFSDRPNIVQSFTADKNAVKRAVDGIKARGNTALYDAAYEAIKSFGEKKGRKVIILLTDGRDDDGTNKPLSKKTLDDVIKAAKETNIPIFAIGLGKDLDEGVLKKLASESGGRYFASPSSADLAALYQEISPQITGQYLVSYATDLSKRDGSRHRVVVKVQGSAG
ncbi:vWA domain-containing protein [Desulfosoma sp.]